MSVLRSISRLIVLGAALTPLAQAQLSSSANYQLTDFALDGGGGGAASSGYGGWFAIGLPSGGTLSSSNYTAGVGFLETSDPIPGTQPIIFGLSPDLGVNGGGTPVTVSGWNFDKFGVGPSVTMSIGGNPSTGLSVLTNTQLTATTPVGDPGPTGVVVTSSLGSGSDPDAWLYTPGVVSTRYTQVGGQMDIRNFGTVGKTFIGLVAGGGGFAGTQYGPFLLTEPYIFLQYGTPYPSPSGVHTLHVNVPNAPLLLGFTVHFQSLEATSYGPVVGQFTNASLTTFQ